MNNLTFNAYEETHQHLQGNDEEDYFRFYGRFRLWVIIFLALVVFACRIFGD